MATLAELNALVGGTLSGPGDVEITGIGSLENAGPTDIAPLSSERYLGVAEHSKAGAFLVATHMAADVERPSIACDFPLASLNDIVRVLDLLPPPRLPGVHPTAVVDETAQLGADVHVGPFAVIGAGARIGDRTAVYTHVVVEPGVEIGKDCVIETGTALYPGTVLGNRVTIGPNCVISRDGFGFAIGPKGPVRLTHVGRVVIEDDCLIGACNTIDRARFDDTRIGRMSGTDNLVHIGHNCDIGERSFLAAQVGLAGMTRLGAGCEMGGQSGVCNQAILGEGTQVAAKAGVIGNLKAGSVVFGMPARDKAQFMRQQATLKKLTRKR